MSELSIVEADYGSPLYEAVTELRRALLRRPLGLDLTAADLAEEQADTHLAALDGERVVGTLLLRTVDDRMLRIMRMAVAADRQGHSVGRRLVEHAEALARGRGFVVMMMHARKTAVGFYRKCGYQLVGGEFLEQGIPHVRMEKRLVDRD